MNTKADVLKDFYHLPDVLRKGGLSQIFKDLVIKKEDRVVRWKGPYGETTVDVFESYFKK